MKTKIILELILVLSILTTKISISQPNFKSPYGNNSAVGKYIDANGTKLYYEVYGQGDPLLLIHGNSGSIKSMGYQIDYFSKKYKVIIPDCRGRGNSELNTDSLTYEQITQDLVELTNKIGIDSFDVVGWSDGGIIGIMMGIHYPNKVKKIVASGANIWIDSTVVSQSLLDQTRTEIKEAAKMMKLNDKSQNWNVIYQRKNMEDKQPNIGLALLKKIKSPVLIVAGDRDWITLEHTILIYQNIPKSNLWIVPAADHLIPVEQPELFNTTIDIFLREPFVVTRRK